MTDRTGLDLIDQALAEHNAKYVIALFSGGHDSLVATHVASQHLQFSFACHLNTGIGIEQTRDFVRATCEGWQVELREYEAANYIRQDGKPAPQRFEEFILAYGFPGPAQHSRMYQRLKERPLRQMIRELDRDKSDRVILVTGVREQESVRRMAHVEPIQVWEGTKIWVAPIWHFSACDVNHYIRDNGLNRNPVVDLLHSSGECLCGAYAHKGEKEEIREWFPEMAAYLDELERQTNVAGFPWGWEDAPPEWFYAIKNGQMSLPGMMLCSTCEVRQLP